MSLTSHVPHIAILYFFACARPRNRKDHVLRAIVHKCSSNLIPTRKQKQSPVMTRRRLTPWMIGAFASRLTHTHAHLPTPSVRPSVRTHPRKHPRTHARTRPRTHEGWRTHARIHARTARTHRTHAPHRTASHLTASHRTSPHRTALIFHTLIPIPITTRDATVHGHIISMQFSQVKLFTSCGTKTRPFMWQPSLNGRATTSPCSLTIKWRVYQV
jgi:hypothetical protein